MGNVKRRTSPRNQAFNDVLTYLAYRVAVCRDGLAQYEASHGPQSRAAATERSAAFEAELIMRDLGTLAHIQRGSREFKKLEAERAAWLAVHPSPNRPVVPEERSDG